MFQVIVFQKPFLLAMYTWEHFHCQPCLCLVYIQLMSIAVADIYSNKLKHPDSYLKSHSVKENLCDQQSNLTNNHQVNFYIWTS